MRIPEWLSESMSHIAAIRKRRKWDKRLSKLIKEMRKKSGLSKKIRIYSVERTAAWKGPNPSIQCIFSDLFVLHLPTDAPTWSDDVLLAVVAHEIAHIYLGHFSPENMHTSSRKAFELECATDMKAAEWVGYGTIIAGLKKMMDRHAESRTPMKRATKKIIETRIMLLDVARALHRIQKSQKTS